MFTDLEDKGQGAGLGVKESRRNHWGLFESKESWDIKLKKNS